MTKHTDPAATAAEFLQLWQEQVAKQMSDPSTIHAMLSSMQAFTQGTPYDASSRRPAASPDAHHDANGGALERLSRRIDGLERAMERLSAKLDAAKNPAGKGVRRAAKPKPAVQRGKRPVAKPAAKAKPSAKPVRMAKPVPAKRKPSKRK